jgi:D-3-phosphoglycerate dehydrogenase
MARIKIFATAPLDVYSTKAFSEIGDIVVATDTSEAALIEAIEGTHALVVRGPAPITAAVIKRAAPTLKVIGRTGVGYDTVDIAAATQAGIPVINTPGAGSRAVAEAAMTYMLALCKFVVPWNREVKSGNWKSRYTLQGRDLDGHTLGIVGLGQIGQMLVGMARPFNMTVVAHDPFISAQRASELGVELLGLDDLLRRAEFISLHCPLTPETTGLISRERLALVKPGSYLVNLARGAVVESLDVLHDALKSGQLGGVGLDVFDPAPPDVSHPIFTLENCLASPHAMATTEMAMTRIFKSMTNDMVAVLRGERPKFVVNPTTIK